MFRIRNVSPQDADARGCAERAARREMAARPVEAPRASLSRPGGPENLPRCGAFRSHKAVFETENIRRIEEMGVQCAAVPKPGYGPPSWLKRERQRSSRKARAWRADGETRIARLKNTCGLRRARNRSDSGVARSAPWAGHGRYPYDRPVGRAPAVSRREGGSRHVVSPHRRGASALSRLVGASRERPSGPPARRTSRGIPRVSRAAGAARS